MKHKTHISNFKTKLEDISSVELSEQEAVESFSNFAGFVQTLMEIDESLKNQSKHKGNEDANIGSSNINS